MQAVLKHHRQSFNRPCDYLVTQSVSLISNIMLTLWKINHEHELDWIDDDNDLSTFIVIVAVRESEFGCSTYIYTNRKQRKVILSKFNMIGHSTLHPVSQFDVRTESGTTFLKDDMKILGKNTLRTFLEANSHRSFTHASLERILTHADMSNLNEQPEPHNPEEPHNLDYLSS